MSARLKHENWSTFGFTTGMAAAAAAVAASEFLRDGIRPERIRLATPPGDRELMIDIDSVEATESGASARVIKNAGPDRDVTDGMAVESTVEPATTGEVTVAGGPGVGVVTLPGLAVPVGQAAINPVPREHIKKLVLMRLSQGARVTVSVAGGAAAAGKTFNPRLGIEGGISILGTTGLVRPMSVWAWRAALLPQLDQAAALGHDKIALTPGNLGARAAHSLGVPRTAVVQMGNFVGYMLKQADRRGLRTIIVGHLGKVIKIAAGYEDTHHGRTRDRMILLHELVEEIFPRLATRVAGLPSAEAAIPVLEAKPPVLDMIASRAAGRASHMTNAGAVGVVVTNLSGDAVGMDSVAREILEQRW